MEESLLVAAVDEVGTSALAGPIVAGAVIYDSRTVRHILKGCIECKALHKKQGDEGISKWFELIRKSAVAVAYASVSAKYINKTNAHLASLDCMAKAIGMVSEQQKGVDVVFVDGQDEIPLRRYGMENVAQVPLANGDKLKRVIAAASIVGRYVRDELMRDMHILHPEWSMYQFDKNFGYKTPTHLKAIELHGLAFEWRGEEKICFHRRVFNDVGKKEKEYLKELPV